MAYLFPVPHLPFRDGEGLQDLPITPLVVGDSRALVLGRPVALVGATSRAARTADAAASSARLPRAAWGPRQWQILAGMAGAALLASILLEGAALPTASPVSSGLPISPARRTAPAVRVVETPYIPPPLAGIETALGLVAEARVLADPTFDHLALSPPSVAVSAVAAAQSALPPSRPAVLRSKGSIPSAAKAHGSAPKQREPDEASRRAVVLDEPDAPPERGRVADGTTATLPVLAVTRLAGLARRPGSEGRQPAEPRRGLIAITPDSRSAVFTNPHTGLPQQFHTGEPLPGGETIRVIDAPQGKVFTSGREYSLD